MTKMITVSVPCMYCGDVKNFSVDSEKYMLWRNRQMLIQDAFPTMPAEDRELFISNICGKCWNEMFNCDDEDEEKIS